MAKSYINWYFQKNQSKAVVFFLNNVMLTNPVALPEQQARLTSSLIPVSLLFVAVFTLSFAAIFIKWSEQYIGPSATIFNRFWISFAILGLVQGIRTVISRFFRNSPTEVQTYTRQDVLLLLISSAITAVSHICWAWSVTQTSVANSNLLHNLAPIFTTLGAWLLLDYRFDKKFLIGMAIAMGSAFTIGIQDFQIAGDHLVGDVLALFSAVFYAGNFLVSEKLRVKFSTVTILLWTCFFRSCITLPVALLTENQIFPSSLQGWLAVICLAVVCQIIGSGILIYSVKRFSSGFTSLFLLLEPIITAILAWIVFSESLSPLNVLTFFLVLVGIYLAKSGSDKVETEVAAVDILTE